jgi:TolB-like protein
MKLSRQWGDVVMKRGWLLFCIFSLMALNASAQDAMPLTPALDSSVPYLISQIPDGSKVLVLSFTAESLALSNYLADEITVRLVNDGNFTVVDRRDLDIIRQEMDFQMSGEVSDETAAGIGKKIGAQSIIFGSMEPTGSLYRLRIRTIEVETTRIQATRNITIEQDALLSVLAGRGKKTNDTGQPIGTVLQEVSDYLIERIPADSTIAVFNIKTKNEALSSYVNDRISEDLVNNGKITVLDRHNHDLIQAEYDFQYSGETSEETTVSIGKKIGAESIVTVIIDEFGELYRLQIRSIEVETARIQAMRHYLIGDDEMLGRLTGKEYKMLYLGIRTGISLRDYVMNTTLPDITAETHTAFEIAALCEVRIFSLFALQTEIIFSGDEVNAANPDYGDIGVSAYTLSIPLLAKLTFRPGNFYFAAFAGPAISLPLGQMEVTQGGDTNTYDFSPTPGWVGGANAGMKLGPGLLFLDARYSGDFIFVESNGNGQYRRNMFSISLGYNYGFITRAGGR